MADIPQERVPRTVHDLFRQGEFWRAKDEGWLRIVDMEASHRLNTARFLMRRAAGYATQLGFSELGMFHDAPDEVVDSWLAEDERRMDDPQGWMRSTALYRALVAGLAPDGRIDDEMTRQTAAAWSQRDVTTVDPARGEGIRTYAVSAWDERLDDVPAAAPTGGGDILTVKASTRADAARGALDEVLAALAGRVEVAKENHEGFGHRGEIDPPCWDRFYTEDVRQIVAEAARQVGLDEYAKSIAELKREH